MISTPHRIAAIAPLFLTPLLFCARGAWGAEASDTNAFPPVMNSLAAPDGEINLLVDRAASALRGNQPEVAAPLLKQLLQGDPAALGSTNGVTFVPARKLAAELIRALPAPVRVAHGLEGPASARGPRGGRVPSLSDVAGLEAFYRELPPGPSAARTGLQLAGMLLDQERFVAARRLLDDLRETCAPGSGLRAEVLARQVVACARMGDGDEAQSAWHELQQESDAGRWADLASEWRALAAGASTLSNVWTMAYGDPTRVGAPEGAYEVLATNQSWVPVWELNLAPSAIYHNELDHALATNQTASRPAGSVSRQVVVTEMTQLHRRPADGLVFAGNRGWVNRAEEFVTVDLAAGAPLRYTAHAVSSNNYAWGWNDPLPRNNRLHCAASLIGGRVYGVEENDKSALGTASQRRARVITGVPCGSALAAYDAATGRLLWRLGRESPALERNAPDGHWSVNAVRFVGAPVMCGGRLLTPIEDREGLGVVGIEPERGTAVWRARVAHGSSVATPRMVPLTADGASIYLCNGQGSVVAMDAWDGHVRWTALYETLGESVLTNEAAADALRGQRWEENLVVVAGEAAVAMPGDSPDLMAFHTRSGALLWKRPKPVGVDYALGVRSLRLFVAGARAVACVETATGRERWRVALEGSTGRGVLRGAEAWIPCNQTIRRVRLEDGADLGAMPAVTMDDLPLGNLYAHGERLLVGGLERLYALERAERVFAELRDRIARNPAADAYARRGDLLARLGRHVEAVSDWREALQRARGSDDEPETRRRLAEELMSAATQDAAGAVRCLAEAREVGGTDQDRATTAWRLAQLREQQGDTGAALSLYVAMLTAPDARVRCTPEWEVSSRAVAAQRLRALAGRDAAQWRALLEKPAAAELARLGARATRAEWIELATRFAGTAAGKEAAFQAARMAAERGDLGIADAILQRAMALSPAASRGEFAAELVRNYERMKWPRGAARLREEWPLLGGGAPLPECLARATPSNTARAAEASPPMPPWRLRWKKGPRIKPCLVMPSGVLYEQQGNDRKDWTIGCLSLETGVVRWQTQESGPPSWVNSSLDAGVVPKESFPDYFLAVSSRKFQKRTWDISHLISGDVGAYDIWSGTVVTNDSISGIFHRSAGGFGSSAAASLASALGVEMLLRNSVSMGVDLLTGNCLWMRTTPYSLDMRGSYRAAGMMLGPDGMPATFPQTECFVAWTYTGSDYLSLDPLTGAVLNRRQERKTDVREFPAWLGPEHGLRTLVNEKGRLIATNPSTGTTNWISSSETVVFQYHTLPSGLVCVTPMTNDMRVLDLRSGKEVIRVLDSISETYFTRDIVNAVCLCGMSGDSTSQQVTVYSPAGGAPIYRGTNSVHVDQLISLRPALSNLLLVAPRSGSDLPLRVVNERGEEVNGWRLPKPADRRYAERCFPRPYFTPDEIVVFDEAGWDILVYEHDPAADGKPPDGKGTR